MNGRIVRLGIDLRKLPEEGEPGAGIDHASLELAQALERASSEYGMKIVRLTNPKAAWRFRGAVRRSDADALLVPSGAVPPFTPVPAFPWVHDVEIFRHPEWFGQSKLQRFVTTNFFLKGIKKAKHIFAVSEDTKKKLIRLTGLQEERITVTYQGTNMHPHTRASETEKPYVLVLGTVEPRKNVSFIVDLWPELRARLGTEVRLVVAGRNGWGRVHIPKRSWLDRIIRFDDTERDLLLTNASALLVPSWHEGFGRAALEGLASGIPVIASRRGALPEVIGDAGVLLEPDDREAWLATLTRILTDRNLTGGFRARGLAQAKRFSWDKTARTILAKLKEMY